MKKTLSSVRVAALACVLLTGCTTTITNLTPTSQDRNPAGLYPVEVALDTRDHTIRDQSVKPFVVVEGQAYPMQPTFMLDNRWEAMVLVPPDREFVNYHFKFDYDYNSIPRPRSNSKMSRPYQLQVLDK